VVSGGCAGGRVGVGAREMDGRVMLYIPSFSFAYSSALTTVTVHCAVKPPQSAVRVVVP